MVSLRERTLSCRSRRVIKGTSYALAIARRDCIRLLILGLKG